MQETRRSADRLVDGKYYITEMVIILKGLAIMNVFWMKSPLIIQKYVRIECRDGRLVQTT